MRRWNDDDDDGGKIIDGLDTNRYCYSVTLVGIIERDRKLDCVIVFVVVGGSNVALAALNTVLSRDAILLNAL